MGLLHVTEEGCEACDFLTLSRGDRDALRKGLISQILAEGRLVGNNAGSALSCVYCFDSRQEFRFGVLLLADGEGGSGLRRCGRCLPVRGGSRLVGTAAGRKGQHPCKQQGAGLYGVFHFSPSFCTVAGPAGNGT